MNNTLTRTTAVLSDVCRDASCQHALSSVASCECPCRGASHGSAVKAYFPSTAKRTDMVGGFTRSMLAATSEGEW